MESTIQNTVFHYVQRVSRVDRFLAAIFSGTGTRFQQLERECPLNVPLGAVVDGVASLAFGCMVLRIGNSTTQGGPE